ncbi:putative membrane protein [Pandoraea pneumonica]|uniref:Putative membrane protein n=1 Tax=Pandoraea pneumonica TaxID=2508299 RepID=A0A5E4UKB7_9BURK|nr:lysoplasmalogenase [Pandoraea pneumonica]VVE00438.1 putative membrane protein [Pandoraea pneumonica]
MTSNFFQPSAVLPRESRRFWWLAAAAGAGYAISLRGAPYPDQAVAKVFLCALLLFAALYHRVPGERGWLCAALIFSGAGDVLLALPEMAQGFVLGLGAFLLAHLAYFVLFWRVRRRWSQVPGWHRIAIVLVWVTAALAYVMYWPGMGELKAPVVCYVIVLAMMASAALLAGVSGEWAAVGALLFTVSDALIGTTRFVGSVPAQEYAIWILYALAQLLLTAGILAERPGSVSHVPGSRGGGRGDGTDSDGATRGNRGDVRGA